MFSINKHNLAHCLWNVKHKICDSDKYGLMFSLFYRLFPVLTGGGPVGPLSHSLPYSSTSFSSLLSSRTEKQETLEACSLLFSSLFQSLISWILVELLPALSPTCTSTKSSELCTAVSVCFTRSPFLSCWSYLACTLSAPAGTLHLYTIRHQNVQDPFHRNSSSHYFS